MVGAGGVLLHGMAPLLAWECSDMHALNHPSVQWIRLLHCTSLFHLSLCTLTTYTFHACRPSPLPLLPLTHLTLTNLSLSCPSHISPSQTCVSARRGAPSGALQASCLRRAASRLTEALVQQQAVVASRSSSMRRAAVAVQEGAWAP